ncbi:hypothetical protein BJ878DRAFT_549460 [Calycina marina]|uniref:Fatty acid synthase subunit alpha n=1 Tax=Calycina marina TaxID=1763456 RepID=A0A9P8CF69_9HELO|nr:hypothetical protein BJ878DRAFT_549460 [Calycina marina]
MAAKVVHATPSPAMDIPAQSSTEQELAYTLLVELMAYQFASPVQWIQSQASILTSQLCERVIEIGPSNTLTVLLKKSLAAKSETSDKVHSIQREFLSISKDANDIFYHVDTPAIAEAVKPMQLVTLPSEDSKILTSSATAVVEAALNELVSEGIILMEDKPITASQIVRCLIAQKLQKTADQINWDTSIKSLVGGRSTLENEIVGDLANEFGSLPDKVEDTPLNEVCSVVQTSFRGQLGKQSSQLISRMISTKMPGGFNASVAKKYLESRWHLGPGGQDGVLLIAVAAQPSSRLDSENSAHSFLDDTIKKYAAAEGFSLSTASSGDTGAGVPVVTIDPRAMEEYTKSQKALTKMQLEALAKSLNIDIHAGEKVSETSRQEIKVLRKQLDLWQSEHGDFYADAIEPKFDRLKARTYSSYWNWVTQDVLSLYHDIGSKTLNVDDASVKERRGSIVSRADSRMLDAFEYLISVCGDTHDEHNASLKRFLEHLHLESKKAIDKSPSFKSMTKVNAPHTSIESNGVIQYTETPRFRNPYIASFVQEAISSNGLMSLADDQPVLSHSRQEFNDTASIPVVFMKGSRNGGKYDQTATLSYLQSLANGASSGITFENKNVLVTGAGSGSIGLQIVKGLLAGGAQVIVTTSSFSPSITKIYREVYVKYGAKGSKLVVVPFNQGSRQDIESLTHYIYDATGLGWDIDHIVPFAAISEHEREIDTIDSKSEFAHRLMLTNTIRLLGSVKCAKEKYGSRNRPAQVILPLSANHGIFGSDGLYSESKIALESLFNRWHSESWSGHLSVCGASIGWTRGTNLMASNDWLSEDIERAGIRTFSQDEMSFAILCLMTPAMTRHCDREPQFADLNGGLGAVPNFNDIIDQIRSNIKRQSNVNKSIAAQEAYESSTINGFSAVKTPKVAKAYPTIPMYFPALPSFETEIKPLQADLQDMVDLDKVVVITGFSEVGPHGNARTRWEMEAYGEFSIEGCIEMAWIMGLIKYHNGPLEDGSVYCGWMETATNDPIQSTLVKSKYEKHILEHTGLRVIEPELMDGYDPQKKKMLQEVVVEEDLKPIETSKSVANDFKRLHGDNAEIYPIPGSDEYSVHIKSGATLMIPKAMRFDNTVAGLIPTGWSAKTYGIDDDIISQVDNVTLYVLVSTVEALLSSGITDPYEVYQYIHVSEVGNCIGSGLGGMRSQDKMYRGRVVEDDVQQDILQETFINTTAAWVNMLLMSSSGPMRTPVGACATAVESVELGCETIVSGKAKFCLVGGCDDMTAAVSFEFANMKATANADKEFAKGRIPSEISRPATTTRSGFVEAQGAGLQVLATAELALKMGLPVYGILAWSGTASDKASRSVPAPGNGVLTNARESSIGLPSPLLSIRLRKKRLDLRRAQIQEYHDVELIQLEEQLQSMKLHDPSQDTSEFRAFRTQYIEIEAKRQLKEAQNSLGNHFWRDDPKISPIRGALATWNLTIDDLSVVSMHGTSTVKNEKNETEVLQSQFRHLGRAKGNTVHAVTQKYLTGHSKGAAGAWMLNGALQIMETGLIPGNRNADDIDIALRQHEHVFFPNCSIQTSKGVKAISITSFGFGQKGAQAIVIHPKYLFATISKDLFVKYSRKRDEREKKAKRFFHEGISGNKLFVAKNASAFSETMRNRSLLDPNARLQNGGSQQ